MGTTAGNGTRREVDIVIRGKNYTIKELTLGNYGEIENFIKSKYVRLYRESAAGLEPDEVHKRVMEILRTDIGIKELKVQMDATDVAMFTAYLAIRDNEGVTLENYPELLDVDEVNLVAAAVNGLGTDEETMPDEEEDAENPPLADQESP